jgi:hypothetical protein
MIEFMERTVMTKEITTFRFRAASLSVLFSFVILGGEAQGANMGGGACAKSFSLGKPFQSEPGDHFEYSNPSDGKETYTLDVNPGEPWLYLKLSNEAKKRVGGQKLRIFYEAPNAFDDQNLEMTIPDDNEFSVSLLIPHLTAGLNETVAVTDIRLNGIELNDQFEPESYDPRPAGLDIYLRLADDGGRRPAGDGEMLEL